MKKFSKIINEYNEQLNSLIDYQDSENILKRKIVLLEEKAVFQYRNKEYHKSKESLKKAYTLHKKLLKISPNNHDEWYNLLNQCFSKYHDSVDFFSKFFNIKDNLEIWNEKIKHYYSPYRNPIVFIDLIVQLNPNDVEVLTICADSIKLSDEDYAIKCYKKILELDPENTNAIIQILDIYKSQFSDDKALELINSKLYIEKIKLNLLKRKIKLLETMTLYDEALEVYDEYLSIEKECEKWDDLTIFDKIRCMEQQALDLYLEENYSDSFNILKKVYKIFENIPEDDKNYGEITNNAWYNNLLKSSIEKSEDNVDKFFEIFYNLDNETTQIWLKKIEYLIRWNHFGNPVTYCNILLSRNSNNKEILLKKAYVYYTTKRFYKAFECYNKLLKIDPTNNEAKNYKFNLLVYYHKYMKSFRLLNDMEVNFLIIENDLNQLINAFIHYRKYNEAKYCINVFLEHQYNSNYISKLKQIWDKTNDNESKNNCPYYLDWIDLINCKHDEYKCPECGGKLIPILYGLPVMDDDFQKKVGKEFVLGGCVIGFNDPTDYCNHCEKSINMGLYGIDIGSDDDKLHRYVSMIISWFKKYLEKNPKKTIKQLKKVMKINFGMDSIEFDKFTEKLEEIGFIKIEMEHIKLIEGYDKFTTKL